MQDREMDLNAELTISQLVLFFFGQVSRKCIEQWVRRELITPVGKNDEGSVLIRLGDALDVEARTWKSRHGRRRKVAA